MICRSSTYVLAAALGLLVGCAAPKLPPPPEPPSCGSLSECGVQVDLNIGTAVSDAALTSDDVYKDLLASEFSVLTPENAMKFEFVQPEPDSFNFEEGDRLVEFAEANSKLVRGHTLVWHRQLPYWLDEAKEWNKYDLMLVLITHIQKVVSHYKGKIWAWDVVNEALNSDGSMRDNIWHRVIGPEYIDLAFRAAHDADPNALLFFNELDAEGMNSKSQALYELLASMVQRGVPVHGVGLQAHFRPDHHPPPDEVRANMQRLADLGLEIHITEMDVALESDEPEVLEFQASTYAAMLDSCLRQQSCSTFSVWGAADHLSWIPKHFEGLMAPLLFDGRYQPKPAYDALLSLLRSGRPEAAGAASVDPN